MIRLVGLLIITVQVLTIVVQSAPVWEERPYHDEPYYPTELDGVNSSRHRDLTVLSKWSKPVLTYSIINYPTGVSASLIRSTLRQAFDSWSQVTNLDFVESARSDQVDIQLAFEGMNHHRRGFPCSYNHENTLAHAHFPETGDVHFNKKYFFADDTSMEQFLNTAIHELGHSIGLIHSNSRRSIMYGAQLSEPFLKPQPEDVQAIQKIYGVRSAVRTTTQQPRTTTRSSSSTPKPRTTTNLCSLSGFDTIVADHRGNICVLAGRFYYNLNETNPPARKISAKWPKLPTKVDAALTYRDQKTYFFKGDQYWKYDKRELEMGYPRNISLGFPGVPASVDAILLSKTGGFFAFKNEQYWLYDTLSAVKPFYPKPIIEITGFPEQLDAALVTAEGRRYIFSGMRYYEIDESNKVISRYGNVRKDWFKC